MNADPPGHRVEPPEHEGDHYTGRCSCGFTVEHPHADGAAALLWCHLADVVLAER